MNSIVLLFGKMQIYYLSFSGFNWVFKSVCLNFLPKHFFALNKARLIAEVFLIKTLR